MEQFLETHQPVLMWTFCTCFVMFWQIWYRERAITGMEASNKFWEGHEQTIYWALMAIWPIVFKAAFISDVPTAVWYFVGFLIGFSLLGKSVLDYALAFLGRAPIAKDQVKITTETTTETKVE
jgi:polyferredoxin